MTLFWFFKVVYLLAYRKRYGVLLKFELLSQKYCSALLVSKKLTLPIFYERPDLTISYQRDNEYAPSVCQNKRCIARNDDSHNLHERASK